MILALRTDKPESEVYLLEDDKVVAERHWQAHRELSNTLLSTIDLVLKQGGVSQNDLEGIIVYQGPGSFTGLRIGVSVANSIAYANSLPIVATQTDNWIQQGVSQLKNSPDLQVLPHYGQEAAITQPKK